MQIQYFKSLRNKIPYEEFNISNNISNIKIIGEDRFIYTSNNELYLYNDSEITHLLTAYDSICFFDYSSFSHTGIAYCSGNIFYFIQQEQKFIQENLVDSVRYVNLLNDKVTVVSGQKKFFVFDLYGNKLNDINFKTNIVSCFTDNSQLYILCSDGKLYQYISVTDSFSLICKNLTTSEGRVHKINSSTYFIYSDYISIYYFDISEPKYQKKITFLNRIKQYSINNEMLVALCYDGNYYFHNLKSHNQFNLKSTLNINEILNFRYNTNKTFQIFNANGSVQIVDLNLFDYEKKEIEIVEISAVYNDANYEIIGSFNNQLCFNSLNKKNNLVGHVGGISAIDLSNHLRFFVTGSYDHSIRVWDFNGQLKDSIIFNNGGILDLKIIPDKNKIIMACKNSNIYLWNLETKKYRTFRGHNKIVNVIDISNNKDLFISGSRDSSIIIWNFNQENALLKKLYGHNGWITDLKISPNNEYFLSASTDGNIILWDFLGEKKETFTGHGSEVWNICWLSNTHFISSSRDNTICIWSINGNIIRLFSGNSSHVAKIIYNNETNKLNIYFLNGEVRIYKLNSNDIFDKNI